MDPRTFTRVYVWERPVRLYHWVTALAIVVLAGTGLVMGRPPAFMTTGDASSGYWFGTVRFVHFAAAYLLTAALAIRVYWLFLGNRYARWDVFFPLTPRLLRRHLASAADTLRFEVVETQARPKHPENVGHNAIAAWSYALVFLFTIFQIATGFALYAPMGGGWFAGLFAWIVPAMGGDGLVRQWHHLVTWFFVVFTLVHVYLAAWQDWVGGHGEISSMVSGVTFVERR